ncbi:AAA family ATPase [Hydrogenovibrio marinus]|uniref:Pilus assembly protein CpaF n=1 Tax=Hydrogenovibrio marinus TaxID=28885 RepID=A0A067A2Z3_HYDMR|nr:AAA family ATPase [Hydrogenovibrio marinus]KDN96690.1 pilus assembly protein CpaF [Hydrogenovibrio marinus]BBN58927.1 pilus assembly protein CpaE [Hydrogenovibrio marinus]
MTQQLSTASIALKQAIFIGQDEDLEEAVRVSIMSKFQMERMDEVPHVWPDSIDLVLIEYDGEPKWVLEKIGQILTLSKGVPLYVLLKKKDADFIIEANHQGVQGFIECPNEIFHILSILHMQERRRKGKNGNVSSLFSLKGGVGCTAIATNLAAQISTMTENRTVLVDLNMPLGDTALYLNMESDRLYTITDFIYNLNRFDENLIYKSLSQHASSGLYLLPLPSDIGELDNLNSDMIKTIVQSLRKYFDHVIIDCSSDLSDLTLSCLDESDNIVLITEPSLSSLRAVNAVIRLTQRLGYLKDSLKLIVNRDTSNQDDMMEEVIEALEVDKIARVSNDYISFNESLKQGVLLKDFNPQSKVNRQLNCIANMLHNGSVTMDVQDDVVPTANPNWWEQLPETLKQALERVKAAIKNNKSISKAA